MHSQTVSSIGSPLRRRGAGGEAPLILIGMPGAGKSYWAQRLAAAWGREAIDLDSEIAAISGKSIPEIFKEKGEDFFRQKESEVLQEILGREIPFVLATGGGTPCFNNNMEQMLRAGTVVYLEAPVLLLTESVLAQLSSRPLLQNLSSQQLSKRLQEMLWEREVFYRQAHYTVPIEGLSEATFAAL